MTDWTSSPEATASKIKNIVLVSVFFTIETLHVLFNFVGG